MPHPLPPQHQQFVDEFVVDLNGTQAALRAGYAPSGARSQASKLLARQEIQEAVARARADLSARVQFSAEQVLQRWIDIVNADPNELIQHRRGPCRYCNGVGHAYQWKTPREFKQAVGLVKRRRRGESPVDDGGYGYRVTDPINPACPECGGEGVGYTLAVDTRLVPASGRVLYAGAKQTKDGLEIKLHDQAKALENVARHLGMFVDRHEVGGKNGGPINITISQDDAKL